MIIILDPNGIAAATGDVKSGRRCLHPQQEVRQRAAGEGEKLPMLLFRAGDQAPKAVPLSLVARLEDIEISTIEHSGGQALVQYRGRLMPLVPLSDRVMMKEAGNQPVLVFSDHDRSMGLVVDEIVDIVEEHLHIQIGSERPGFMGSAIISGKSTDVVDAGYYQPAPSRTSSVRPIVSARPEPVARRFCWLMTAPSSATC